MKINSKDLKSLVQKELKQIYLIFADESVQISALTDQILLEAKQSNFDDKSTHVITKDIDWSFLDSNNENLDLLIGKMANGPSFKKYCLTLLIL